MEKEIEQAIKRFDNLLFLYNEHRVEFIEVSIEWEKLKDRLEKVRISEVI